MEQPRNLVPDFIPDELLKEGLGFHFSVSRLRPDNLAWKKNGVLAVIDALAAHEYVVLGVDVLGLSEGRLDYSGDYWDLPDEEMLLWEEHVEMAKEWSARFIEDVARAKGESLYYALFFIDQRGYRKQIRDFGNVQYR